MTRAGIETVLLPDPRGSRRSVSLIDPSGRRMALYDPRGAWPGPPPLSADELAYLAGRARHVHVSIMDWMLGMLPALAGTGRQVSTDLHDWDGSAACTHRGMEYPPGLLPRPGLPTTALTRGPS